MPSNVVVILVYEVVCQVVVCQETYECSWVIDADTEEDAINMISEMLEKDLLDTEDAEIVDSSMKARVYGNTDENGFWVYEESEADK